MEPKGLRFFVVEDEIIILESIKIFLKELGHLVVGEALSGEEALGLIGEANPDMLLMDINLPGISGINALNRILEARFLPCIYITGYSDPLTIEAATATNAFGYLIKPVDKAELHAAIGIAVSRFNQHHRDQGEIEKARVALEERKIVERAKAILVESMGFREPQAMAYLQKKSRNTNTRLVDVARRILKSDAL